MAMVKVKISSYQRWVVRNGATFWGHASAVTTIRSVPYGRTSIWPLSFKACHLRSHAHGNRRRDMVARRIPSKNNVISWWKLIRVEKWRKTEPNNWNRNDNCSISMYKNQKRNSYFIILFKLNKLFKIYLKTWIFSILFFLYAAA